MKKTSKMTLCIGVALTIGVILGQNIPKLNLNANDNTKRKMIAMYLENEDGGYNLSSQNKFPTEGYVLNTEKSTCKNGGTLSQDPTTKKLSLSVSNSDQCTVYFDKEKISLLGTLLAKANDVSITSYTSGNQQEMYTFDHEEAEQTTGWSAEERRDYRYIGNNPNNYIIFNDETWRIIGVFTVETEDGRKEQLMKIIRNESIGKLEWDSSSNDWSTSSLKTLLNGDYYNQSGSYSSTSTVKGLSTTAREQIENVKWYLGESSTSENLGGPNYYSFERGTTVYSGRSTNIVAKVGLMYPSDYVYTYGKEVNDKCYTDGFNCNQGTPRAGWLFNSSEMQWTISPRAGSSGNAFAVNLTGQMSYSGVNYVRGARPTVYLKSNIQIKSGTGASGDPYVLG